MTAHVDSAAVIRPMFGETVSGDAAFVVDLDEGLMAVIVDVLGHGEEANELAVRIQAYLQHDASEDVVDVLRRLHNHFRGSRGAAVGVSMINAADGRLRYAGIGNTVIRRFGQVETRLVARDGVVGGRMRSPIEETMQLEDGDLVVLYTDGAKTHFAASEYPGLRTDTASAVADNIVQRFGKSHDDASCVAVKYQR